MSYKIAKSRYKSIKERSFETFLDLFLIRHYLEDPKLTSANFENFQRFSYYDDRNKDCLKAYQLASGTAEFYGQSVKILDDAIDQWYISNELAVYKNYYFQNFLISESRFLDIYGEDKLDRGCEYCKIKESDITYLIKHNFIGTKRLSTRGRSLEVDRRFPNKGYTEDNIVLCCYWCNNAKTDEFTHTEFIEIGNAINKVWQERLNDNRPTNQ